jgi:hypothetical protein
MGARVLEGTDCASTCLQVFLETGTMSFLPDRHLSHGSSAGWRESSQSPSWASAAPRGSAADWTRGPGAHNLSREDERARSESAHYYISSAARQADRRGSGGFRQYPRAHNLWIDTGTTPSLSPGAAQHRFDWEVHRKVPSVGTWEATVAERQYADGEHRDRRWRQYLQYRGQWVEPGVTILGHTRRFPPPQSHQPSPNSYPPVVASLSQCDTMPPVISHFTHQ